MRLIPYLYTAFAGYAFEGDASHARHEPRTGYAADEQIEKGKLDGTENPYAMVVKREVKDQFMVGENLLVAPLFAGETERKSSSRKADGMIFIPESWQGKAKSLPFLPASTVFLFM